MYYTHTINQYFNMKLLKTKYNMLYTRNQSVQRCKYFPPRVIKTSQLMMYKAKVATSS